MIGTPRYDWASLPSTSAPISLLRPVTSELMISASPVAMILLVVPDRRAEAGRLRRTGTEVDHVELTIEQRHVGDVGLEQAGDLGTDKLDQGTDIEACRTAAATPC